MKPSRHALQAALLLSFAICFGIMNDLLARNESSKAPSIAPAAALSLLYTNSDISPIPAQNNMNIRPDFRLINHTAEAIAYSRIKVRYYFTVERQAGLFYETTFAKFGKENVIVSFTEIPGPFDRANYFAEISFNAAAGFLPAFDTTIAYIRTRFRKSDYTNFEEENDFSYLAPGAVYANQNMTVFLDGALVWGNEPAPADPVQDLRLVYSRGSAEADTQIPIVLRFENKGNTEVPLSELKVRYWFSESDVLPLQYIEWYIGDESVQPSGAIVGFSPERDSANHYLEISFDAPGTVIKAFSDLRNFKFKIVRQGWKPFTSKFDDYSYDDTADEFHYKYNDHITLYRNDALVWGTEPPVLTGTVVGQPFQDFHMYPQPATDNVTLERANDFLSVGNLRIYDFSGNEYPAEYAHQGNKIVINIESLGKGFYYVDVELDRKSYKRKLVVD
jgi:hypothetical protein